MRRRPTPSVLLLHHLDLMLLGHIKAANVRARNVIKMITVHILIWCQRYSSRSSRTVNPAGECIMSLCVDDADATV